MFCLTDAEIADLTRQITRRPNSLFESDVLANQDLLENEIRDKSVLVIGGAGTIGSSYIKQILRYRPQRLLVVDTNENGLAELVRDVRSSNLTVPQDFTTYPMDLGHPLTIRMIREEGPFDIVANFAALKHVRSEKNYLTTAYLVDNNVTKAEVLLSALLDAPPSHFFCVSTDKAANPVNVMGATKRLMEDLAFGISDQIKSSTARFANVAFSNGSLLDAFLYRLRKGQPFSMPGDVRRYLVSWEEAGQLCLLASITGNSREVFTPKLDPATDQHLFTDVAKQLLDRVGYQFDECSSEQEARDKVATMHETRKYPCHVFPTDTTGEKAEEEFSAADETVNDDRYEGIRVVMSNRQYATLEEVRSVIREFDGLCHKTNCTKADVVAVLAKYLPTFQHQEKHKNLDSRM